jgi:hypothetical protein
MELQMMKKVKTAQMMSQSSEWNFGLNTSNSNKTAIMMNSLNQNPYEAQFGQNQLSFEFFQPNSLLN